MKDNIEWRDICVTCNNATSCSSRKDFVRPVWFCEEYDDYVPLESCRETLKTSENPVKAGSEGKDTSRHLGLCVNCDYRETCTFTRPAGGVWHCEEYK